MYIIGGTFFDKAADKIWIEVNLEVTEKKFLTYETGTFSGQHEAHGCLLEDKIFWVPEAFVLVNMIQPVIEKSFMIFVNL